MIKTPMSLFFQNKKPTPKTANLYKKTENKFSLV